MGDPARRWREMLVAATSAVALFGIHASAAAAVETRTSTVDAKQVWTSTGVYARKGQTVAITATGLVHFGMRPIDALPPAGLPWPRCTAVAGSRRDAWPAPGIACWSLIAQVGDGLPIAVGAGRTITADRDGTLQLGVNDNELSDNSGLWNATIVVVSRSQRSGGSSAIPLILAIAAAVLLALAMFVLLRRRRAAPVSEERRVPVVPAFERPATAVSPGDEDVNIYEVELTDEELRVGYSYFPDGIVVRWRIAIAGETAANGEFTTLGGPGHHDVRFPIACDVARAARAEVVFDWCIGAAAFSYAVTRQVA